jgi:hypothetical protein
VKGSNALLKEVDVNGGRRGLIGKLLGVMFLAELERGFLIERGLEEDFQLGLGTVWLNSLLVVLPCGVLDVFVDEGVWEDPFVDPVGVFTVLVLLCGVGNDPLLELDGVSCVVVLPRGVVDVLEVKGVGEEPLVVLVGDFSEPVFPWGIDDEPLEGVDRAPLLEPVGVSCVIVLSGGVAEESVGMAALFLGVSWTDILLCCFSLEEFLLSMEILVTTPGVTVTNTSWQLPVEKTLLFGKLTLT